MTALPAAPGVLRVALSGTLGGSAVWLTRFYLHFSGTAPTIAQLATFNAAISTAYNADLLSLVDGNCTLTTIESTDLTSATGATATATVSDVGSRTGGSPPANVCFVVSYEINRRYRGGHPLGYWRFGTATDVANARTWSAGLVTAVGTGMASFFTALEGAGWTAAGTITQVNVSYYSKFTVVISPTTGRARNVPTQRVAPTIDTVTAQTARAYFGSQRRREAFVD